MNNKLGSALLPAENTQTGRWLAIAQQVKDTLTIAGMNILLLFGILCGVAIPGLILYSMRWRLTRKKSSREGAMVLWGFSFFHELLCVFLFRSSDMQHELGAVAEWLSWGYALGMALSLAGYIADASASVKSESYQ